MVRSSHSTFLVLPALLAALLLGACGGGGSSSSSSSVSTAASTASLVMAAEPDAPQATGNTATDGFNWFNFRRQQLGLQVLERSTQINTAAQGHSDYQKINNAITHEQTPGMPGFTGATLPDRFNAAGYQLPSSLGYAYGEVISSTGSTSGASAAEDLITAIYHRFVIFEPMFKEAGTGAATVAGGSTYFTADFAAKGLDKGLGGANFATYPYANQQNIPTIFNSDYESPDPVADRNAVGYPISIHVDILAMVTAVQSFTVQPRGGTPMPTVTVTAQYDASQQDSGPSAVAIIPLDVLTPDTTYDVQFAGTIAHFGSNGSLEKVPVSRAWSFKTR